jgi:hypothetical protein
MKNVEKENDTKKESKDIPMVSYKMADSSLVEMLHDPVKKSTSFAWCKDGKVKIKERIKIENGKTIVPYSSHNNLLTNGFLVFPSVPVKYENELSLFEETRAFINKYVYLTPSALDTITTYVMMTWLYDKFSCVPYLRAVGMWGTGKSRLLEVVGKLCYKSMMAGGSITPAALFRTIDSFNGTLIFDEAELSDIDAKELLGILRQGHNANFKIIRMDKGKDGVLRTKAFKVFGPKIMASEERSINPAFESRCLSIFMYPGEESTRPISLPSSYESDSCALRNKLLAFRFKNFATLQIDEMVISKIKLPRMKQTGLAIAVIAKLIGEECLKSVILFLKECEQELEIEQADNTEYDILRCLIKLAQPGTYAKRKIYIGNDLTEQFNRDCYEKYSDKETKKYDSYDRGVLSYPGYRISAKKMGGYVRRFGISLERAKQGFFIDIQKEYPKILLLAKRYGLEKMEDMAKEWVPPAKEEEKPPIVNTTPDDGSWLDGDDDALLF